VVIGYRFSNYRFFISFRYESVTNFRYKLVTGFKPWLKVKLFSATVRALDNNIITNIVNSNLTKSLETLQEMMKKITQNNNIKRTTDTKIKLRQSNNTLHYNISVYDN